MATTPRARARARTRARTMELEVKLWLSPLTVYRRDGFRDLKSWEGLYWRVLGSVVRRRKLGKEEENRRVADPRAQPRRW